MEKRFIDLETDKELLISNLDLSERAKNILKSWLKIKTFGELLEVDYQELRRTRTLGEITLKEIVDFVHKKGYFLKNEYVDWETKREKLLAKGLKVLEDEIPFDLANFLYKNNLFTLKDLKKYGYDVFELKGMGKIRKKTLEDFLKTRNIILHKKNAIDNLEKIKKKGTYKSPFNQNVNIKDIGNLWFLSRDALIYSDIVNLEELINLDYNELKEKIWRYISNDDNEILLEIVNFLHSYGFSIKGYDRTVLNTKLLIKDNDNSKEITQDDIGVIESENLSIQDRMNRKKNLIKEYNEAIAKHKSLLEEEAKIDLELSTILARMEQSVGYDRKQK